VHAEQGDLLVWGFTAGLLSRLLELAGWAVPWDTGRQQELAPDVVALARRSSPALEPGVPGAG
jgi:hypothetical protein